MLLPPGGAQTSDISSTGGGGPSDAAAPHHARHPAQPHQPAAGHRPGSSARGREHGLRRPPRSVCHAGERRLASGSFFSGVLSQTFYFYSDLSAPAVPVCDSRQQLWFPGVQRDADSGQTAP